jgi:flagellar basal body rod protein FlgC
MMVFFAVNNANAWVGEGTALAKAVTEAQNLKASYDPINPNPVTLVKIDVLNNMINLLTTGSTTADAYYASIVFKSSNSEVTTVMAVDSRGVDTKSVATDLYNLFQ